MKKEKKHKRRWLFSFLKKIVRPLKKKVTVINLNKEIEDKAIYISNHSAASGPFSIELFFPKHFIPWGTHEMTENYKARWNYLYHIFYKQKLGYNKFKSFILATLFAVISRMLYKGMGLIPTYRDSRLFKTFKMSIKNLNNGVGILIFPENSDFGYKEVLEYYNAGFVTLSKMYYKKTKIDLPVYNIYYSKKYCKMVIDKPIYINKLFKKGLDERQIAEYFMKKTNRLYLKYIKPQSENK